MRTPLLLVTALVLLAACSPRLMTPAVTESEKALCDVWQDSLPTRSRNDTAQTQTEIGRQYDLFLAVCPAYKLPF
jgi:hypothetical protein